MPAGRASAAAAPAPPATRDTSDRSSPYLKWRIGVVVVWLVLSTAAVAFAFTGGQSNDLGAVVNVVDTGFGIALDVQNKSDALWQNVTVTVAPGGYLYRQATLRAGDRLSVQVARLERIGAKGRHEHPKPDFKPSRITIRTSSGSYSMRPGARPR